MPAPEICAFGEFTLDATGRSLSRGGAVIHLAPKAHDLLVALVRQAGHAIALAPKAYDLLVMLVRNGGRVLTKRELLTSLWPECSVDEGILSVHVAGLRKSPGDVAHAPRFIEPSVRSATALLLLSRSCISRLRCRTTTSDATTTRLTGRQDAAPR